MPGEQLSLFSTVPTQEPNYLSAPIDQSVVSPVEAFDQWLTRQQPPFRKSSQKIYRWLWGKFIRELDAAGINFLHTEPNDITVFLASLPIKRPQRERYQKIITRAFDELTHLVPNLPVPETRLIDDPFRRTWRNAPSNEPTQFLTLAEQRDFQTAIRTECLALLPLIDARPQAISFAHWKRMRDLTIVTLLFSCGVKPAELAVLSVSCIYMEGDRPYLDIGAYQGVTAQERRAGRPNPHQDATHAWRAEGFGADRHVPLAGWAYRILARWLHIRSADPGVQGAPGSVTRLFPGSRKPTPARPNSMMNMATLARIVSAWGAKHVQLDVTAQRLRNTYGAQLLEQEKSLDEIERLMGYAPGAASAFRLRTAWSAFSAKRANLDAQEAGAATPH